MKLQLSEWQMILDALLAEKKKNTDAWQKLPVTDEFVEQRTSLYQAAGHFDALAAKIERLEFQ